MKTFLFILFIILTVVLSTVLDLWFNTIPSMIGGYTIALFLITLILNYMERQLAMNWWNNLSIMVKIPLAQKYVNRSNPDSLTGREIESIYIKEHKPINV